MIYNIDYLAITNKLSIVEINRTIETLQMNTKRFKNLQNLIVTINKITVIAKQYLFDNTFIFDNVKLTDIYDEGTISILEQGMLDENMLDRLLMLGKQVVLDIADMIEHLAHTTPMDLNKHVWEIKYILGTNSYPILVLDVLADVKKV